MNNLRKDLDKACDGVTGLPGHLFEMWLFACNLDPSFQVQSSKLADFDMDEDKNMMQDVLIPRFVFFFCCSLLDAESLTITVWSWASPNWESFFANTVAGGVF